MAKVAPSGITGNTSFGRLLNEPELVNISIKTMNIISQKLNTSLNGIFTLDFKEDKNGVPKITEINIRHVAFTASLAAGGANIPLETLKTMFSSEDVQKIKTQHFSFAKKLIFLRDVDGYPMLMEEENIIKPTDNR
jgi:carbamoyl-phosphate synthase large subunit